MKIIDIHTHCNSGSLYDCPETGIHKRSFEFMMEDYKNVGISAGGFSYYSTVLSDKDIYESNAQLYEQAKNDDRVYQWLTLDPRQDKLFDQIRSLISGDKVLGIKIHSVYHKYDILEYGDKIFSFANELGCFVLMHPDKTMDMVEFANKYPNMKLIIAHLRYEEHIKAIEMAKHGNIYTDTSSSGASLNNIIEHTVERVGSEKIFFGTDTYSCGYAVGRIMYARISDKDKENILYNNAKINFKKQFENI